MFKWLLVIAIVVLGYVWWRHQRQGAAHERAAERTAERARQTGTRPSASQPDTMIRCRHCGVHLPAADAVHGSLGPYCSDEHRRLAEG